MMKIAVITEFYEDQRNANAYCAHMLVKGIVSVGICADVFTFQSNLEFVNDEVNINVYSIENEADGEGSKEITKRYILTKHIQNIRLLPKWPLESPELANLMLSFLEDKISEEHYDGIIAIHKTYLSIWVCENIKKNHPEIQYFLYLLDPIANPIDKRLGLRRFLFPLVRRAERKAFVYADYVLHMKCNKPVYESDNYGKYREKFYYLDFPLIQEESVERKFCCSPFQSRVRFIYFGTLNRVYRSPEYMVCTLLELSKITNIEVDIYTQGDCLELFVDHDDKKEVFKVHDFVDSDKLEIMIKKSDVILNVGNAISSMLPSKILEMIMYGKPIISFSKQQIDVCDQYLSRYGKALIIKESEEKATAVEKILSFLSEYKDNKRIISEEDILNIFYENTPKYSGKTILELLRNNNE